MGRVYAQLSVYTTLRLAGNGPKCIFIVVLVNLVSAKARLHIVGFLR